MEKISLESALEGLARGEGLATLTAVNDTLVKAGRFNGRFPFHRHDDEDELFWVIAGRLTVELRDRSIELSPGEMLLVPRGVEHRTAPPEEARVVVIHPRSTRVPAG